MIRIVLTGVALLLVAGNVDAHTRSESWSEWQRTGERLTGIVTAPAREVTRLPEVAQDARPLTAVFADYLARRVTAAADTGACETRAVQPLRSGAGHVRVELSFVCPGPPTSVDLPVLFDRIQGHTHFARLAETFDEALLEEGDHRFRLTRVADDRHSGFRDYLGLGTRHILGGPDHIAFLVVLLLAAAHWRNALIAITGFTVGHSITLSLAVLGLIHASAPRVEAFIGYTIALVAAELVALRDGYWRSLALAAGATAVATGLVATLLADLSGRDLLAYLGLGLFSACYLALAGRLDERRRRGSFLGAVAVLFGLIHGLGFAGFLLETGLPRDSVLLPLLGFNLGVEFGQVLLVGAALILGWAAARLIPHRGLVLGQSLAAAALCGLGLAWFAARSLG